MSTILQKATAFTPAPASPSPSSPLLWIPLDEVRQAWASFGAEALSCPALLAAATAFRALCWETSALRYYGMACQPQRGGLFQQAAAPWLDRVVSDLGEAVRDWRSVQFWLERFASSRDTWQDCTEPLEQVGALSEQIAAQQQRLRHLLGQVWQERSACRRDGQAAARVTPRATTPSIAAGVAAAAARAPEEESETWPNT